MEIGNFACLAVLAPPLLYSIGWEYLSGQSGLSGLSGHDIMHNLQFLKIFSFLKRIFGRNLSLVGAKLAIYIVLLQTRVNQNHLQWTEQNQAFA